MWGITAARAGAGRAGAADAGVPGIVVAYGNGQQYVSEAYDAIQTARDAGNTISVVWIPASAEHELLKIAKDKAREATQQI